MSITHRSTSQLSFQGPQSVFGAPGLSNGWSGRTWPVPRSEAATEETTGADLAISLGLDGAVTEATRNLRDLSAADPRPLPERIDSDQWVHLGITIDHLDGAAQRRLKVFGFTSPSGSGRV